jgi:predicted nucleotidyltransferase component of viral defense system
MNTLYEQMVSAYQAETDRDLWNAKYEVTQQITLAGLHRGGFFEKAAFYGGTCLRIFHGLKRFSEDMDFTLLEKDSNTHLENYFEPIIDEFKMAGRDVIITKKEKMTLNKVESAFLKDETDVYNLTFSTEKKVKVKIEIDTKPPLLFDTEQKLLRHPYSFMTRCMTLPCLYAGKMHALTFRNWKTRVKGRDWYDFEWYVRNNVPLNYTHLQKRIEEFNGEKLERKDFMEALKQRLASTNINVVKDDVIRFVEDPHALDIWSNDYFLQLAEMIRFV